MNTITCQFCDADALRSRNLILTEDLEHWTIAGKGQLTEGYVLHIPRQHVPCYGAMNEPEIEKCAHHIQKIRSVLENVYGVNSFVMFEHGVVGQTVKHAHMHFMPGITNLNQRVWADFPLCSADTISSLVELPWLYQEKNVPYLLWQDSESNKIRLLWNPPAPAQYFRKISAEKLGRSEQSDWSSVNPVVDFFAIAQTTKRLYPHFTHSA
ncbi:MAG: HIT domain-containing protein [bacterium]|nr:HIT domain-containing protein [bacterium]